MKLVFTTLFFCSMLLSQAQPFELKPNDVIALTGGSNIERTRFNGYLQTSLIASKPELKIKVRNFGWEGDTVFEQWRDGGHIRISIPNVPKPRSASAPKPALIAGVSSAIGNSNSVKSAQRW
jgi:hypothetical protein